MNSNEVFIHIHHGCFAGTGAVVRLSQCQWSKPDGYGKISQCITTTKHSIAKTVCIFLGIYLMAELACRCQKESLKLFGLSHQRKSVDSLCINCLTGIIKRTKTLLDIYVCGVGNIFWYKSLWCKHHNTTDTLYPKKYWLCYFANSTHTSWMVNCNCFSPWPYTMRSWLYARCFSLFLFCLVLIHCIGTSVWFVDCEAVMWHIFPKFIHIPRSYNY